MLDTGLTQYQIDLGQGRTPLYCIFALSTLDRLGGEDLTCMSRFTQGDLISFDLVKDHNSITGYPLTGKDLAAGDFYLHFLQQTNRYVSN